MARSTKARAEELLHDYDSTFLECRSVAHRWVVVGYYRQAGEILRRLVCDRCDTERTDHWRPTGARIANAYRHADGYLLAGTGGVDRTIVRREVLGRVNVYENEESMVQALFKRNGRTKK